MEKVHNSPNGTISVRKLGVPEELSGSQKGDEPLPESGKQLPTKDRFSDFFTVTFDTGPALPNLQDKLTNLNLALSSPGISQPTLVMVPPEPGTASASSGTLLPAQSTVSPALGVHGGMQLPQPETGCPEHGLPQSHWCQEESRAVCLQCPCQDHHTRDLEESATKIRNKIVDHCETLQLKTAGIEKYVAEVLPGKNQSVACTASCAREQIIQRLMFVRNVCENEEQRLLEEVHAEEERAQQGILTQRAYWEQSAQKLATLRTYLVDVLTKMDDRSLMLSQAEIFERTEEAEGILEPKESEKLNFNQRCVQSPLLNGLWASAVLCCTTGVEDILIDEKTISHLLSISEDKKILTFLHKKPKKYEDCLERFNYWPNAFASKSFQAGLHAWRISVEKSVAYKVGIAYGSLQRKGSGNDSRLGYNPVSWVFSRYDKDFRFSHDSQHQAVELLKCPKQIGVLVDWDGGELLFYDPDSCVVLHSHHANFTSPVFPVFAVADDCIKIT
ncbi:B box and SPRY domain-containing protein [Pleurodeles waltl]|uniref:B box and SPRY domain-containing protein n=1 Tax=Pleurodeles waltl TaxID=8319 RepID=UPI003709552D